MSEDAMTEAHAIGIVESLTTAGVRSWVMGGWGIDALLGLQTRMHHDLDLIVCVCDLPLLGAWLKEHQFSRAYEWEENAPVLVGEQLWDTAFVALHADGRELDIHAVHLEGNSVRLATNDPWRLPPNPLDGIGVIGGRAVACMTAEAQRAMHRGYVLPEKHREDLQRLKQA